MLSVPQVNLFNSPKIISLPEAAIIIKQAKTQGRTVSLCHGGFDLLHPGHIIHFESAKKLGDLLMVSVTSDKFVAGRKGSGRPVFPEQLRAYNIAALQCVDYVVITDFEKAVPILELLQPSYYIKGPDFIGKSTPGITAEREAIASVGGEMKYTTDPKLSTTEIIEYIKHQLDVPEILIVVDRDGTLIEHESYLGKEENWKEKVRLNNAVVDYLIYLQTKYKTTKIIATNQSGVARGYFDCSRVDEIHAHLANMLSHKNVKIDNWQYCPDVDATFVKAMEGKSKFNSIFVKEQTKRKPNPGMVVDGLQALNRQLSEFNNIITLGDREEDQGLAENIKATFIDVKRKTYEELKKEFA